MLRLNLSCIVPNIYFATNGVAKEKDLAAEQLHKQGNHDGTISLT